MAIFIDTLKKRGFLDSIHLNIAIIGSRKIGESHDFGQQGWNIFAPRLSIYGFDADTEACEEANRDLEKRQISWYERHFPLALSDRIDKAQLYVTKDPMCSSLYPPNEPYLKRFIYLLEVAGAEKIIEIETTTLDDFCNSERVEAIDFIQIDVQGAELQVLMGAETILQKSVLALVCEVNYSHLYIDQPLFSDVDIYLRSKQFTLFGIYNYAIRRAWSPIVSPRGGQILWGDATYFRNVLQEKIDSEQALERLFKLACIADMLGFEDYTVELLVLLTLNCGTDARYNFADCIVESLSQIPELDKQRLKTIPIIEKLQDFLQDYNFADL